MKTTQLLDPDDDDEVRWETGRTGAGQTGEPEKAKMPEAGTTGGKPAPHAPEERFRLTPRRTVSAVDLRRRTSEVIAALERNEELMISYRDQWVGTMTPINLVEGFGYHPPLRKHRYFGYARRAPRLRRKERGREQGRDYRADLAPEEPTDDLLGMFDPPGQLEGDNGHHGE
jgi:antitoxin (DNA-binding transcriptional repressor) of toxin-antitoxin stability system